MSNPTRLLVANLDKDKANDRAYVRSLRRFIRRTSGSGILGLVELGHGARSTRVVGVRLRVRHRPRIEIGDDGAHNGVDRAWVRIDGVWVMVFVAHGLHRKTAGREAHDAYFELFARHYTRELNFDGTPWVILADFNDDARRVCGMIGGAQSYNAPGDVMGVVVSPGLRIVDKGSESIGHDRGWTGHREAWVDVQVG